MGTPTKDEVRASVIAMIAPRTTVTAPSIRDTFELKLPPLLLDDTALAFLADELNEYLERQGKPPSMTATALRKAGITVGATVATIQNQVGAA